MAPAMHRLLAACSALLPLLAEGSCRAEGRGCNALWDTCCSGLQCQARTLLTWRCGRCEAEGQTCGGPGRQDTACCNGLLCESRPGSENKFCVPGTTPPPQPTCKAEGEKCGCVGCPRATCCGGLKCQGMPGSGDEFCQASLPPPPQCKAEGEKCGCAGCPPAACCGGLECQGGFGGSDQFCRAGR